MRMKLGVSLGLVASFGVSTEVAYGKPSTGPHLVVVSVKAAPGERQPFHRFVGGQSFQLVVKVKNTGTTRVSRKGEHDGVLLSKPSGGLRFVHETDFTFPRIGPGKTATVDVNAAGVGAGQRDRGTTATPRACVPVRGNAHFDNRGGLSDRQNCAEGPGFGVIYRRWNGTMSVTHTIYGYAKLETDALVRFTYDDAASAENGNFRYSASGSLVHSVSGSGVACSITGGANGKIGRGEGFLAIDRSMLEYSGGITHSDVFTAKQTCSGFAAPAEIRTDGLPIPSKSMDESDVKLQGTAPSLGGLTFKWDLDVE